MHSPSRRRRQNSNQQLQYPVLPFDDSISSWIQHSRLVKKRSKANMASHANDSSVDGLSSIGDGAWQEIDERSACSGSDINELSRQLTPMSESHDPLESFGISSFMSTSTSGQTPASQEEAAEDSHAAIFTPTAASLRSNLWSNTGSSASGYHEDGSATRGPGYIKLQEEDTEDEQGVEVIRNVTQKLFEIGTADTERICSEFGTVKQPMDAYLSMNLGRRKLCLNAPFELLYVGPKEMKTPMVEKIGSALTAGSDENQQSVSADSSRVTVVPVSAFQSNVSPEVVLIDSVGVDMKILECNKAWHQKQADGPWPTIILELNDDTQIESSPSRDGQSYDLNDTSLLPHLAIVYVSGLESGAEKLSREAATTLLHRHQIPFLIVSSNTTAGIDAAVLIDSSLPHLVVRKQEGSDALLNLPIDMATFSALDASQLNRSLECSAVAPTAYRPPRQRSVLRIVRNVVSIISNWVEDTTCKLKADAYEFKDDFPHSLKTLWFSWIAQIRGRPVYYTASLVALLFLQITVWILEPSIMMNKPEMMNRVFDPLTPGTANLWISDSPNRAVQHQKRPAEQKKMIDEISLRDLSDVGAFLNIPKSVRPDDKVTYRAKVLGESHVIIIRDGQNGIPSKVNNKLNFGVRRSGQQLVHDVSQVSDGVHVIELPAEDAYGKIIISVSSNGRPKVNETFQVDFGTPWLKISTWLNSAQNMNHQAQEELITAQSSLLKVVKNVNARFSLGFQGALSRTAAATNNINRARQAMFDNVRQAKSVIDQKRQLASGALGQLHEYQDQWSGKQQRRLRHEWRKLARQLHFYQRGLQHTSHRIRKFRNRTASVLDVGGLGRGIQRFRSKHSRHLEKKLLHIWWKVSSKPKCKAGKRC